MFKPLTPPLTVRSKAVLLLFILFVICVFLSYCLVFSLQPCGHLLGKGWPLGSLVCDVFYVLSLSHMVFWVGCGTWLFDFWSLPSSLLLQYNKPISDIFRCIFLLGSLRDKNVICLLHLLYILKWTLWHFYRGSKRYEPFPDLGPYCLLYRLQKYVSRWEGWAA